MARSNLQLRIISALILLPVVLAPIYAGGMLFAALLVIASYFMGKEWMELTSAGKPRWLWTLLGIIWIVVPLASFYYIREFYFAGYLFVLWILLSSFGSDTCAYAVGKTLGGPKLAPSISPNKTISGAVGGMIGAAILGVALWHFFGFLYPYDLRVIVLGSIILAVISQFSDLLESKIKRHFNVKDSGSIIPGHGGVLDRTDSLILTAPAFIALYELYKAVHY